MEKIDCMKIFLAGAPWNPPNGGKIPYRMIWECSYRRYRRWRTEGEFRVMSARQIRRELSADNNATEDRKGAG